MRTHRALLAASAIACLAAASEGNAGGNANSAAAEPAVKYYLATAESRAPDPTTKETVKVTFVVSGPDYKTAWATAREVTRVGTTHFDGNVWADKTREKKLEDLRPGSFTVKSLDSLQERRSKQPAVTLDNLLTTLEERNISIPAKMREVIDELRASGPIAPQGDGAEGEEGRTGTTG